jgi:glycosyltransferase involved in cell wall biosynthesis
MKTFVLAITTYNRLDFLTSCISSWDKTKSTDVKWELVIADDGSNDGTINYIKNLNIQDCQITLIKNNRLGIHQQMNTILKTIEKIDFDFCFKIDDDITFLKPGWDFLYYNQAIKTGYHHLIFCERKWEQNQHFKTPVTNNQLKSYTSLINTHGFFYTLTKETIKKIGYFDVNNFGFRGMGHIDYTARACRSGYNAINNPYDVVGSEEYITAYNEQYSGAINKTWINAYDEYYRLEKETIIKDENRIFIPYKELNYNIYDTFTANILKALSQKIKAYEEKEKKGQDWYKSEKLKIENWYNNQYSHLPNWYLKIGKIFKYLKKRIK